MTEDQKPALELVVRRVLPTAVRVTTLEGEALSYRRTLGDLIPGQLLTIDERKRWAFRHRTMVGGALLHVGFSLRAFSRIASARCTSACACATAPRRSTGSSASVRQRLSLLGCASSSAKATPQQQLLSPLSQAWTARQLAKPWRVHESGPVCRMRLSSAPQRRTRNRATKILSRREWRPSSDPRAKAPRHAQRGSTWTGVMRSSAAVRSSSSSAS